MMYVLNAHVYMCLLTSMAGHTWERKSLQILIECSSMSVRVYIILQKLRLTLCRSMATDRKICTITQCLSCTSSRIYMFVFVFVFMEPFDRMYTLRTKNVPERPHLLNWGLVHTDGGLECTLHCPEATTRC